MNFEWDENKRKANIEKHGIDFEEAVRAFDKFTYKFQDTRADYGEERYVSIGVLNGIEITIIHTPRGENERIISVRRARIKERKIYYAAKDAQDMKDKEAQEKGNGDRFREAESNER